MGQAGVFAILYTMTLLDTDDIQWMFVVSNRSASSKNDADTH